MTTWRHLVVPERHIDEREHRRLLASNHNALSSAFQYHLNEDPNPHDQYVLNTEALNLFAWAGYGEFQISTPAAGANLGLTWEQFGYFDTIAPTTPRGFTFTLGTPDTFSFDYDGVYKFTLFGAFEHNESNQGRQVYFRFYNQTQATAFRSFVVPTGRNTPASVIAIGSLVEVTPTGSIQPDDVIRLEVGGTTDSYTSVTWEDMTMSIHNVGEWRGPIEGGGF